MASRRSICSIIAWARSSGLFVFLNLFAKILISLKSRDLTKFSTSAKSLPLERAAREGAGVELGAPTLTVGGLTGAAARATTGGGAGLSHAFSLGWGAGTYLGAGSSILRLAPLFLPPRRVRLRGAREHPR